MTVTNKQRSTETITDNAAAIMADPRWFKIVHRDKTACDFVFAVKSTGIYCLAGCPARRPHPQNISFYNTAAEAQSAGCGTSKPCQHYQADAEDKLSTAVEKACRLIEQSENAISLAKLEKSVGLSPYNFQRQFKIHTGLTPKRYEQNYLCRSYTQNVSQ